MNQPAISSGPEPSQGHTAKAPLRIRIFHQADPLGTVPGGVDTFIRGLIKWAPPDIEYSLVGMTTEPAVRPVGRWTRCRLGDREFDFFPVFAFPDAAKRSTVPLTLRVMAGALLRYPQVSQGFDVLDVHRVEPLWLFRKDPRPKNAFFHQDMAVLSSDKADIRWRSAPGVYRWAENRLIPRLASAWCVRESAVTQLRTRFPTLAPAVNFVPTWVDPQIFSLPATAVDRQNARQHLRTECGWAPDSQVVVTVGRLDSQKDPHLLLDAFALLTQTHPKLTLAYVGDGVLRTGLQTAIREHGLGQRVRLLGLRRPEQIADILRGADVFALSSAYEGMPMAVLEALGSGVPVVTTDVGEIRRVVINGQNGQIVIDRTASRFADVLHQTIEGLATYDQNACIASVCAYKPLSVLKDVYDRYRALTMAS